MLVSLDPNGRCGFGLSDTPLGPRWLESSCWLLYLVLSQKIAAGSSPGQLEVHVLSVCFGCSLGTSCARSCSGGFFFFFFFFPISNSISKFSLVYDLEVLACVARQSTLKTPNWIRRSHLGREKRERACHCISHCRCAKRLPRTELV